MPAPLGPRPLLGGRPQNRLQTDHRPHGRHRDEAFVPRRLKERRCLVVATGFYEWRTEGKAKLPFHIFRQDHRPFAFAGLWERWTKGEAPVESCTIVTTDANDFMKSLHNRMPVILDPKDYDRWLGPTTEPGQVTELLHAPASKGWEMAEVSPKMNNARFEGPEYLEPAG